MSNKKMVIAVVTLAFMVIGFTSCGSQPTTRTGRAGVTLSGTFYHDILADMAHITFSGNNFTLQINIPDHEGTHRGSYTTSGNLITLSGVTGTWTIVDSSTLRDNHGELWKKMDAEALIALSERRDVALAAEREERLARIDELQERLDGLFAEIDKSEFRVVVVTQQMAMISMAGMGSPFRVGGRYKTLVSMGRNTHLGATFLANLIGLVDRNFRIPELLDSDSVYYLYFTVNSISGNDHFITVNYIELPRR